MALLSWAVAAARMVPRLGVTCAPGLPKWVPPRVLWRRGALRAATGMPNLDVAVVAKVMVRATVKRPLVPRKACLRRRLVSSPNWGSLPKPHRLVAVFPPVVVLEVVGRPWRSTKVVGCGQLTLGRPPTTKQVSAPLLS